MPIEALLILSALLLFFVGWFARGIWKAGRESKMLTEHGIATTATISRRTSGYDQGTETWSYLLTLSYHVNETSYQEKIGVSPDDYNQLPEGSSVEILYLPENPKSVMLKPRR